MWLASRNPRTRAVIWQAIAVMAVAAILAAIAMQTAENLRRRGIASGFDYLHRAAGFEIARGPLSYSSGDTYGRALAVGLLNTLLVSSLGIIASTGLGVVIGIARLSRIGIASTLASTYVEVPAKHAPAAPAVLLVRPVAIAATSAAGAESGSGGVPLLPRPVSARARLA